MKKWGMYAAVVLSACDDSSAVYTMYRTPIIGTDPVHVATFDAADGRAYNEKNCTDIAAFLTDAKVGPEGIVVGYFCRRGRFQQ